MLAICNLLQPEKVPKSAVFCMSFLGILNADLPIRQRKVKNLKKLEKMR